MGLHDARRAGAAAAIAGRSRPLARRTRLLYRKPPCRERQGEAPARLDAALSDLSRGVAGDFPKCTDRYSSTSTPWIRTPTSPPTSRSEEHTAELKSLMRISYPIL